MSHVRTARPAQTKQAVAKNSLRLSKEVQGVGKRYLPTPCRPLLETDWESHLGCDKYDMGLKHATNNRYGHSRKNATSQSENGDCAVPRDRERPFNPIVAPQHQTTVVKIKDQIIPLDARSKTTRDILTRRTN